MATKLQLITELANTTSKELSNVENWMAFLNSASWQYKYSFEDQVLIYAQRPDARACADFDTWNEKLKRRINRGAKGIALLRERGADFYLDHVFDVSDTYKGIRGVDIKLWEYDDKYDDAIIETLENTFGELKVNTTLVDSIICAAHNAVEDWQTLMTLTLILNFSKRQKFQLHIWLCKEWDCTRRKFLIVQIFVISLISVPLKQYQFWVMQ